MYIMWGLTNYFRRFIRGYASLCRPLTDLTLKDAVFLWTDKCQEAYTGLKEALIYAPVLALPDFDTPYKPFDVICDASGFGIGAVLMQNNKPIAFEGRKMTDTETRYTVGEQELLAVHHALQVWRCYLEGTNCPVNVITDHKPNTYLASQPNLSRRQARWSEFFQRFKLNWQYRPGRTNVADPLSRNPEFVSVIRTRQSERAERGDEVGSEETTEKTERSIEEDEDDTEVTPTSSSEIDEILTNLRQEICESYESDEAFRDQTFLERNTLVKENGVFLRDGIVAVPAVPSLRTKCIKLMHSPIFCGHLGANRTQQNLRQLFWWQNQREDVLEFVKQCPICQRDKHQNNKPSGLLQSLPIPKCKWESVSIDFITDLPRTRNGCNAIMVVLDRLTKMVHFSPTTTNVAAYEVARLFRRDVFRLHGLPRQIVSDRDTRFTSKFWRGLMKLFKIKLGMSTSFHPQTDGQTERVNRILEDMLRHYVNPMLDDWDDHLDAVEFAVNNAWQESIRTTPFMLNYGQRPLTPVDLAMGAEEKDSTVPAAMKFQHDWQLSAAEATSLLRGAEQRCSAEEKLVKENEELVTEAQQNMSRAQKRQKLQADKKRSKESSFEVGSRVLLSTKNIKLKHPQGKKLLPLWIGPFEVEAKIGEVAYKLKLAEGMRMHNVFHVSLIKAWREGGRIPPPLPELIEDYLEYEVEQIISYEKKRGYLVKWLGYGHEHNTWEPEKHLQNCKDLVQEYWDTVRLRSEKRGDKRPYRGKTSGIEHDDPGDPVENITDHETEDEVQTRKSTRKRRRKN